MKKINLMPSEYKAEEIFKLIRKSTILVVLIPVFFLGYLYIGNIFIQKNIDKAQIEIDKVDAIQRSVNNLEYTIQERSTFLQSLDKSDFELNNFVEFLNYQVPDDLNILSVDSKDRLTSEEDDRIPVQEVTTVELDEEGNPIEVEPVIQEPLPPENMKLIVRGYSTNNTSIADLIYKITLLDFVGDVQLSAIEEKYTPDGYSNVFELIVDIN